MSAFSHLFDVTRSALLLLFAASPFVGSTQQVSPLHAYEECRFTNGLAIEHVDGLGPGIASRPIKTRQGTESLRMAAGRRIMVGFPDDNFFANTKSELLPAVTYTQQKQLVIDGFDYILASDSDVTRDYGLHSPMNGFELHGLDRTKLEGGVLGIYLLFDDAAHVATTIYLLNQEVERRKFADLAANATLRDEFLRQYAACIRSNQQAKTP